MTLRVHHTSLAHCLRNLGGNLAVSYYSQKPCNNRLYALPKHLPKSSRRQIQRGSKFRSLSSARSPEWAAQGQWWWWVVLMVSSGGGGDGVAAAVLMVSGNSDKHYICWWAWVLGSPVCVGEPSPPSLCSIITMALSCSLEELQISLP